VQSFLGSGGFPPTHLPPQAAGNRLGQQRVPAFAGRNGVAFVHEFHIFNTFFFYRMMDEFFNLELEDEESQEGWGVELPFDPMGNSHPSLESNGEIQYQESAEVIILLHQCEKD